MTASTGLRIIVAEDDPDILELVVIKLGDAGFDIVAVTDGVAALAAIEADPPRLAILDIRMPGMSGVEVLRRVRATARISALEVMLLTAFARDIDIDIGFAAGADDYIIKPFSPRELLERVYILTAKEPARSLVAVEDDGDVQLLIASVFGQDSRFVFAGAADTAEDALQMSRRTRPRLIVLDQALRGEMTGLQAAPMLKEVLPSTKIILFTAHGELRDAAVNEPAVDAFLLKTDSARLLPLARELMGMAGSARSPGRPPAHPADPKETRPLFPHGRSATGRADA